MGLRDNKALLLGQWPWKERSDQLQKMQKEH